MYEIKEFYGKDTIRFREICCELFRYPNAELENREEYAKKLEEAESKRNPDYIRMGAFWDDVIYAAIEVYPYNVNFDGRAMKMGGIGNVVSLPNSPQKGAMKEIYKKSFEKMRENGQYISHLYPFNANYYRQYGYDLTCGHCQWSIPVEYIPQYKGVCTFYDGSDRMQTEIRDIYAKFSSRYNMAVARDAAWWNKYFEENKPYMSDVMKYVHYTDGAADGFVSFKIVRNETRPMDFVADKIWFSTYDGLKGVLSYFVTQKAYGDRVVLNLPCDVDLAAAIEILGGWGKRNVEVNTYFDGTTRVVDVKKVLEAAKCKGEGEVCIKIDGDTYCPWNNGTYTLKFGTENIVEFGGEADIEMDINAFSSLIFGRCELDKAGLFSNIKVIKNEDKLKNVFYKKDCFIEEHF